MEIKSKSLDEINEITYDTKAGITTTTLVHTINFEKYKKMYGGESEIFKILLEELKKGTFSDCDEEFQYCCYHIISNLQQENQEYKEVICKIKEYCNYNDECLYTFEPDYDYEENLVDNYEASSFREDILDILKEVE